MSVARRTGEIGVRLALGAQPGAVLRMILWEAFGLLGAGLLLGAVGIWVAGRFVREMLYGVSAFDAATVVATVLLLAGVTLMAAWIPARRAARIDPMDALRAE